MYPEDRVLVAYMPEPEDFRIVEHEGWYRIPQRHAPKGLYAEYVAFYFGQRFGVEKWAVHYYCERLGHELTTRADLFPEQAGHPRADQLYYKVQLGPLLRLERPIVSLRWRRLAFVHTTWDRFRDATEINDLFVDGEGYVDRLYAVLKENGLHPERRYRVRESGAVYEVPLAIPCKQGRVDLGVAETPRDEAAVTRLAAEILSKVAHRGGETTR